MREEYSFAEKLTSLFSDIIFKTMTVQLLRELDDLDITLPQAPGAHLCRRAPQLLDRRAG